MEEGYNNSPSPSITGPFCVREMEMESFVLVPIGL
jgi:hypothetical protein